MDYLLVDGIDWSRFAYAQYVTNTDYLCNSVMLFETLHRLGSKAERMLMYPATFDNDVTIVNSRLLEKARDDYHVILVPVEVQHKKLNYSKAYISPFCCKH
jgi:hypothetical protein